LGSLEEAKQQFRIEGEGNVIVISADALDIALITHETSNDVFLEHLFLMYIGCGVVRFCHAFIVA
jgi:hypothetical protein